MAPATSRADASQNAPGAGSPEAVRMAISLAETDAPLERYGRTFERSATVP